MGTYISLHGRAFGFDAETGAIIRNGSEGGSGDQTVSAASTTSTIAARGITSISSSSASYTLAAPIPGVRKDLVTTTASTLVRTVTLASGNLVSTAGSTGTIMSFTGVGQTISLQGLSTALYSVRYNNGVAIT